MRLVSRRYLPKVVRYKRRILAMHNLGLQDPCHHRRYNLPYRYSLLMLLAALGETSLFSLLLFFDVIDNLKAKLEVVSTYLK